MSSRVYLLIIGESMIDSDLKYYEYESWQPDLSKIVNFPGVGQGLNKYGQLLPGKITVSLGEGNTLLTKALSKLANKMGLQELYIKHEEQNPTGCFKDRESAVVISEAVKRGYKKVYVVSSGNAALSTAAYAQKAEINCVAYVPRKTSNEKKSLIKLFGAKVVEMPGFYEDVYRYVVDSKLPGWNVTSGQNLLRTEANKTIAFEIWEQVNVPDIVVVPVGNGGCLAGIYKGFYELKQLKKIDKIPQLIAVQVKGAAPLSKALEAQKQFEVLGEVKDSIAEGIVASESYCSPKAVKAIKDSKGYVIEVTDKEIIAALKCVIEIESLISEPTSAAAFAALFKLKCSKAAKVVCVNTGSGMKCLSKISKLIMAG